MSKLQKLSGKEIIRILTKEFGFEVKRVKGSHAVLTKIERENKAVTVVPLHKEVKTGTLLGIIKLAGIKKEEFIEALRKRSKG